jgi:hypothetical protein
MVAIIELRTQLAQIGIADRFTAQRTTGISTGCPPIHQNDVHVSPRNLRQANVTATVQLFTPASVRFAEVMGIVVTCCRAFPTDTMNNGVEIASQYYAG